MSYLPIRLTSSRNRRTVHSPFTILTLSIVAVLGLTSLAAAAITVNEMELVRFSVVGTPTPFGWSNFAGFDIGDVDGDGANEFVLSRPVGPVTKGTSTPDILQVQLPHEEKAVPFQVETYRLAGAYIGEGFQLYGSRLMKVGQYDLTFNGLTVADLYPTGPAEIWFSYLPKVGALEYDGKAFPPKEAWQTWGNKPVVLSRYGARSFDAAKPAGKEKLLALANFFSPEVAVGLVTVDRPIKCPSKDKDVQAAAFFSPKDRFAVADINEDGREELLAAYSKYSSQFPARPFVVTDLWDGSERATLAQIHPDDVVAGDMDADGKIEVILSENVLEKSGWPKEGYIHIYRWTDGGFRLLRKLTYPRTWVGDLSIGDVDNDKKDDLVAVLLERPYSSPTVILKVALPYAGGG